MVNITTAPVTAGHWEEVQRTLTGGGDGRSCQCQWPMLSSAEFRAAPQSDLEDLFRREIDTGPPPGLVGYVNGEAMGWVRIGPRSSQQRITRMRIVKGSVEPIDDPSVWALTCFSVRREARRMGLTTSLLHAAVDYARANGARIVEAYPIDTDAAKTSSNELFVGALSTFLAAGFTEIARPTPKRAVVSLQL